MAGQTHENAVGERLLVLGGVRSGKSRWAEQLAARWPPVTYLATGWAGDEEMSRRIDRHRQLRPASWRTIEDPWDVAAVVAQQTGSGCLILECVGLWLTNLLVGLPGRPACDDAAVRRTVAELAALLRTTRTRIVVVSNETGCGIMPVNPLARRFGDLLGEANQQLAAAVDEVYWCVAGIPVRIKPIADCGLRIAD